MWGLVDTPTVGRGRALFNGGVTSLQPAALLREPSVISSCMKNGLQ